MKKSNGDLSKDIRLSKLMLDGTVPERYGTVQYGTIRYGMLRYGAESARGIRVSIGLC